MKIANGLFCKKVIFTHLIIVKKTPPKSEISDIKIYLANIISKEVDQLLHLPFLFTVLSSFPVKFVLHCLRILQVFTLSTPCFTGRCFYMVAKVTSGWNKLLLTILDAWAACPESERKAGWGIKPQPFNTPTSRPCWRWGLCTAIFFH